MSGSGLALFDGGVTVPAPLSMRLWRDPFDRAYSVIVDGPPGAVELQICPATLNTFVGGMSILYHSRRPMPGAQSPTSDCAVLGGAVCYSDSMSLGPQGDFERWFRARDGQAIVDALVRRYQTTTWTLDNDDADNPLVLDAQSETLEPLPAQETTPPGIVADLADDLTADVVDGEVLAVAYDDLPPGQQ